MKKTGMLPYLFFIAIIGAFVFAGFIQKDNGPEAAPDEITLRIQLDVKEDIGLLIIDADIDGTETSGGISNADRSMLKHNEILYWTFNKWDYDHPGDTTVLNLRFRIITEYCDPNYENSYPEDYTVLLEPLSADAEFGKSYSVMITGDKESGYQAVIEHDA